MIDDNFSLMRAHRSNIVRYRRLLKTSLTDLEWQFVERRVAEEQSALEKIVASTFPLLFGLPASPATMRSPQSSCDTLPLWVNQESKPV
jgi:hypothetical protein